MITRGSAAPSASTTFRIGEVAKLTGLTPRTLRYWEEQGLLRPTAHRGRGERRYTSTELARISRIRDLQELLGFSLAEVRVVLDTEDIDVLDRVRSEYHLDDTSTERRRELLDEAIEANEKLLERLDVTLARIGRFREERAAKSLRLQEARDSLDDATSEAGTKAPAGRAAPGHPRR